MLTEKTMEKLRILAESAKYDVSCSSSGTVRKGKQGMVGNTVGGVGICHSLADDGRCISLLKVMLTNYCMYDCAYCINRRTNDIKRATLSVSELEARNEVKWETYTKKIQIEARVLGDLSMNHIIPVATSYQSALLKNVERMTAAFPAEKAAALNARNLKLIEEIGERTATIEAKVEVLVAARRVANKLEDEHQKAIAYHDTVAPMFDTIRRQIDKLELIVDDSLWPLPKYRELLFIR